MQGAMNAPVLYKLLFLLLIRKETDFTKACDDIAGFNQFADRLIAKKCENNNIGDIQEMNTTSFELNVANFRFMSIPDKVVFKEYFYVDITRFAEYKDCATQTPVSQSVRCFVSFLDMWKLHGITDEDILQLPNCLQDKGRVFIISIQESNFTISAFVTALPDRVKQLVVDLEINRCTLTEIPTEVLSQSPKLRYINLQNNTITELAEKSFSNMAEVQIINLSHNRLQVIHTETFVNLPRLNELSLQNNLLLEIEKDAFEDVPSLKVIYLDNNRLKSLPYNSFRTLHITFLHVTNNNITEISSDIKLFKDLVNLDIRNNSLQKVSGEISTLHNLQELHLSWNNLTTLPEELLILLENASLNIALRNNPLDCSCNLAWLISWVSEGFTKENVVCETPEYVNMSQFDVSTLDCDQLEIKQEFGRSGYIILASVSILVCISAFATVLYFFIWNKKSKAIKRPIKMIVNGQYYVPHSADTSEINLTLTCLQDSFGNPASPTMKPAEMVNLSQRNETAQLRLGKRLGRGAFGDVFEGLRKESKSGSWKKVAVKKLRENAVSSNSDNLITEYHQLIDIGRHPNIIQVYGIGQLEGSLIMVMELAENGDLLAHLKEIEHTNQRTIKNLDSAEEKFYLQNNHPRLFLYMWHIAKGMEYLTQLKVIHRDLAARNILLAAGHVAKLCDFGLSRDVYENGYYYQTYEGRLPYKWMSPETLSNGKFTPSSDVWSYGVLLWEIMTLGSNPYPGIPPDMLINMYKSKYIMPQPPLCPDNVCTIMKTCWKHIPEERTNFTSLVEALDSMVQIISKKPYMDVSFDRCCNHGDEQSLIDGEMS